MQPENIVRSYLHECPHEIYNSVMSSAIFQEAFGKEPELTAFAPGRIEFLGNHTAA